MRGQESDTCDCVPIVNKALGICPSWIAYLKMAVQEQYYAITTNHWSSRIIEAVFALILVSRGCANPSKLFLLLVNPGEPRQRGELKELGAISSKTLWRKLMPLAILRT